MPVLKTDVWMEQDIFAVLKKKEGLYLKTYLSLKLALCQAAISLLNSALALASAYKTAELENP